MGATFLIYILQYTLYLLLSLISNFDDTTVNRASCKEWFLNQNRKRFQDDDNSSDEGGEDWIRGSEAAAAAAARSRSSGATPTRTHRIHTFSRSPPLAIRSDRHTHIHRTHFCHTTCLAPSDCTHS